MVIGSVIQHNAELALCQHSYPLARQQQQQSEANVVKTKSGMKIGCIFVVAFGMPLAGLGGAALLDALGVEKNDTIITVAVVAFVVILLGTIFWTLSAGARVRAKLQRTGVRGQAQVLAASETGTRINNQPVVELTLNVQAPGGAPYRAAHREVISSVQVHRITPGTTLTVLVDPRDPRMMAIEWGG